MTEEFLHYLWKYRLLKPNLRLSTGENCVIIDSGIHNKDSGPDFFNAKIQIEDTLWAGNVEIHLKSSDWSAHKHNNDKAYENVILHVVRQNDKTITRNNGQIIPTLEIGDHFPAGLLNVYNDLMNNRHWVPCEKMITKVDRLILNNWFDRLMVERLEEKTLEIASQLDFNRNNWEQTFYEFLARNFGFKVNALPFDLLAKSLPISYLGKHKYNKMQIEALLFGQAGLLNPKLKDPYAQELFKEYNFLRDKYRLTPLDPHIWRFMRLRPANFPTIRIAQFADLIYRSSHLFSKIIDTDNIQELKKLFSISVSGYWTDHFRFDKRSKDQPKKLGSTAIHLIILNTIIPFLFIYGSKKGDHSLIDRSLRFLDQLPGENNNIVAHWNRIGMGTRSAFTTQALIQLKNQYCNHKQCLNCAIGNNLLKQELKQNYPDMKSGANENHK